MNRSQFRKHFGIQNLLVFPVIHVVDAEQISVNVQLSMDAGCPGVFLINHDFHYNEFLPLIRETRSRFPDYWLGVNFLAVTGKEAFPLLAELGCGGCRVDAYWADDARIDEHAAPDTQAEAREILDIKKSCGWHGMYFGGTAFKKQREVAPQDYAQSARIACDFMDVVTTSGIATGHSADLGKINTFRKACDETPIALASGITPENVADYLPFIDATLVATGINKEDDFYNIDPSRLDKLLQVTGNHSTGS